MLILVMGVAGAGKTTVGRELARQLGWTFLEADEDHPPENIEKMRAGIPLTDADRIPWLEAVRARVREHLKRGDNVVLACSALKRAYRAVLERVDDRVVVVELMAPPPIVRSRLLARSAHFMPAVLLESQYDALERPEEAIVVNAAAPVDEVVAAIRATLRV